MGQFCFDLLFFRLQDGDFVKPPLLGCSFALLFFCDSSVHYIIKVIKQFPAGYIALTIFILTAGHYRSVGLQSNRANYTIGNRHDICPTGYIALAVIIFSAGHYRTIGFQPDRIAQAGGNC